MPPPDLLHQALRGSLAPQPVPAVDGAVRPRRVVVAGGAGPLGSAVLTRLLAGPFAAVSVLVQQRMDTALRGLHVWPVQGWQAPPAALQQADIGVVVFDRGRSRHGREAAFVQPAPEELPALAGWLQRCGVQQLVVVLPHTPGLLPQALRAGLASLDEQAVAQLGFEQLVFVRPARPGAGGDAGARGPAAPWLARLGRGLLAQMHWMVPQREQALRAQKVAAFVADLAAALPTAPPGTRVVGPELVWDWSQPEAGHAWLQAWLRGEPLPPGRAARARW